MQPKSRKVQGVSFEPDVLREAKQHAAERRMSLSAYINQLISQDQSCELSPTEIQFRKKKAPAK